MAKQANASLEQAKETLRRMVRETYKWIVAPMQEARPGKGLSDLQWEHFQVNPGAQNLVAGNRAGTQGERTAYQRVGADSPGQDAQGLVLEGRRQGDVAASNVWQKSCSSSTCRG